MTDEPDKLAEKRKSIIASLGEVRPRTAQPNIHIELKRRESKSPIHLEFLRVYDNITSGEKGGRHRISSIFSDFEKILVQEYGLSNSDSQAIWLEAVASARMVCGESWPEHISTFCALVVSSINQSINSDIYSKKENDILAKRDFSRSSNITVSFNERDRNTFPTAEIFLKYFYSDRLGASGDLTPALLGKLDPPLLTALNAEFRGRLSELHKLLPTLKERNDQKLLEKHGYIPEGSDRKKKLTAMARLGK